MTIRFAIVASLVILISGFSRAQQPKPSDDVNRRLTELEKRVETMLREVQSLRVESKARDPKQGSGQVRIFALKFASAPELAKTLKGLLQGPDSKDLNIAVDERTNSLLVKGDNRHLEVVEAVVMRLDQDTGKPGNSDEKSRSAENELKKSILSQTEELREKLKGLDFELHLDPQQWRERAEWLKKMSDKGFISPIQIELDLKSLEQARDELMKVREQLMKQLERSRKAEGPKKPVK